MYIRSKSCRAKYKISVCNFKNSPVNSITKQAVLHAILSAFHHRRSYVAPRTFDLQYVQDMQLKLEKKILKQGSKKPL